MFHDPEGSDLPCSYIIRQQMILIILILSDSQHICICTEFDLLSWFIVLINDGYLECYGEV